VSKLESSLLLAASLCLFGQEHYRLELKPLDIEGGLHLPSIDQIESDGQRLYLRSMQGVEILVVSPEGKQLKAIGGRGGHPGELGEVGAIAMSVQGNRLWAVDTEGKRARLYVEGRYETSFPLKEWLFRIGDATTNAFAFSDDRVLLPAPPNASYLGAALNFDGATVKRVGEVPPFATDILDNPERVNAVYWLRHEEAWWSVHKFMPIATRYGKDFRQTDLFQLASPIVDDMFDRVAAFEPTPHRASPTPVFTDTKIFRNRLYVMSGGRLHQIDMATGKTMAIASFYGTGPDFAQVTLPQVTLFSFAFLDDGSLVLAHPAMLWNHDLWRVEPPWLTGRR